MLYQLLKPIVRLAVKIYFKNIVVEGLEKTPKDQPIIFAPNHPGAFLDPLLMGTILKRDFYIITRGESFKSKIKKKLFGWMNMIPVYRPDKTPEKVMNNKSIFNECYEHLGKGRCILIFPEGHSKTENRLRKIKTGAARIAIGYQNSKFKNEDVIVVPIGINYDNPQKFQSKVYVSIAEPIKVSEYLIKETENSSVKRLTNDIKESILLNIKFSRSEETDDLLEKVEKYYLNELESYRKAKSVESKVRIFNAVEKELYELKNIYPRVYKNIESQLMNYSMELVKSSVNENQLKVLKKVKWGYLLRLILQTPFALIGIVTQYLSFKINQLLSKKLSENDSFIGAMNVSLGLFNFAITYFSWSLIIYGITNSIYLSALFYLISPIFGLTAYYWVRDLGLIQKWISLKMFKRDQFYSIRRKRTQLIQQFDTYFEF